MEAVKVSNYGVGDDLLETLLKVMATATSRLWIKVAWWDASPKGRELAEAAIGARRRGLDVRVLCRPESSNDAVLRELRQSGITIVGVRYIHEKEVLADDVAVAHSMNFTDREIERNQNSGFVFDAPDIVTATEAGFRALIENRAAASVGDEEWTPSSKLIPRDLQKYLSRFDRLNPLQSKAVPAVLSTSGHVMVVAPTSSGKTLIGEVAALRSIVTERKPAVWLLPARALAAEVSETARSWNEHGIRPRRALAHRRERGAHVSAQHESCWSRFWTVQAQSRGRRVESVPHGSSRGHRRQGPADLEGRPRFARLAVGVVISRSHRPVLAHPLIVDCKRPAAVYRSRAAPWTTTAGAAEIRCTRGPRSAPQR